MIPAVILATHTTGLGVIRALGRMGVPVIVFYYDKKDMGYVSRFVVEKFHMPHPEQNQETVVGLLTDYANRHGRCLLVPTDDATLTVVSRHKDVLGKFYEVACPDWSVTEKIINKRYTYELAERCGIPCPKTYLPKSLDELEHYGQHTEFPCLVKPCKSHQYDEKFKKKLVKAENRDQLYEAFVEAQNAGIEVMLQEYIPGDVNNNVNYNSYFWEGSHLVEFTARKIRLYPPEFGVPCVVKSDNVEEILEPGRRILSALGHYGYSCTEFKKDPRDGVYKLMEVNGRHNRSTLLSVQCGLNFPWIEYCHRVQGEVPEQHSYRTDVFWIDEAKDIFQFLTSKAIHSQGLGLFCKPYGKEHVFSVLDYDDFSPICKRLSNLLQRSLKFDLKKHVVGTAQ